MKSLNELDLATFSYSVNANDYIFSSPVAAANLPIDSNGCEVMICYPNNGEYFQENLYFICLPAHNYIS